MTTARAQALSSSTRHPDPLRGGGLYAARTSVTSHDRELNRSKGKIQGHPRGKSALEHTDPSDPLVFQLKRHPGARRLVG
jgi:hypothetical protein